VGGMDCCSLSRLVADSNMCGLSTMAPCCANMLGGGFTDWYDVCGPGPKLPCVAIEGRALVGKRLCPRCPACSCAHPELPLGPQALASMKDSKSNCIDDRAGRAGLGVPGPSNSTSAAASSCSGRPSSLAGGDATKGPFIMDEVAALVCDNLAGRRAGE